MKKQTLNEEVSRIKDMMGKLMNEKFDNKQVLKEFGNLSLKDAIFEFVTDLFTKKVFEKMGVDSEMPFDEEKEEIYSKVDELAEVFDLDGFIKNVYNLVEGDYDEYEKKTWNSMPIPEKVIEYATRKIDSFLEKININSFLERNEFDELGRQFDKNYPKWETRKKMDNDED